MELLPVHQAQEIKRHDLGSHFLNLETSCSSAAQNLVAVDMLLPGSVPGGCRVVAPMGHGYGFGCCAVRFRETASKDWPPSPRDDPTNLRDGLLGKLRSQRGLQIMGDVPHGHSADLEAKDGGHRAP